MDMLTPPTDSLYKFMAIFGLVLLIASFFIPSRAEHTFDAALIAKLVEDAKLGQTLVASSQRQLELSKQLSNFDPHTTSGAAKQMKILQQMESPDLNRSRADLERNEAYIKADEGYKFAKDDFKKAIQESEVLQVGGVTLSALGFYFWYVKVQRFLDLQMRNNSGSERALSADNSA